MPSSGCKTCARSEEHTSELQPHDNLVCRLLLEKKTPRPVPSHDPPFTPARPSPPPRAVSAPKRRKRGWLAAWRGVGRDHAGTSVFFLMIGQPPISTLFPSTTLSR